MDIEDKFSHMRSASMIMKMRYCAAIKPKVEVKVAINLDGSCS